jgi:hypothetical protein
VGSAVDNVGLGYAAESIGVGQEGTLIASRKFSHCGRNTYLQLTGRVDMQTQLTHIRELVGRRRQDMVDSLKRREEQMRRSQPREAPARP